MSDVIDCACDREQHDRDLCLAAARMHKPALPFIGQCYNCETSLPEGVRFCDCECRTTYEHRVQREVANGIR